jgi:hypothetical protein
MDESQDQELYTDYALQLFSAFIKEDIGTMQLILELFQKDGKGDDNMFMPGLIYGFMYHLSNIFEIIAESSSGDVESVFSDYALGYANTREHLFSNKALNVSAAKQLIDSLREAMMFEEIVEDLKED